MKANDLKSISTDELWKFYGDVTIILARKIATEKATFEARLRKLEGAGDAPGHSVSAVRIPRFSPSIRTQEPRGDLVWSRQDAWMFQDATSSRQEAGPFFDRPSVYPKAPDRPTGARATAIGASADASFLEDPK